MFGLGAEPPDPALALSLAPVVVGPAQGESRKLKTIRDRVDGLYREISAAAAAEAAGAAEACSNRASGAPTCRAMIRAFQR